MGSVKHIRNFFSPEFTYLLSYSSITWVGIRFFRRLLWDFEEILVPNFSSDPGPRISSIFAKVDRVLKFFEAQYTVNQRRCVINRPVEGFPLAQLNV